MKRDKCRYFPGYCGVPRLFVNDDDKLVFVEVAWRSAAGDVEVQIASCAYHAAVTGPCVELTISGERSHGYVVLRSGDAEELAARLLVREAKAG